MEEHYFTADPATPFKRVPVRTNVWGHWLELTSGSGVFAQGRLDTGTGVLLREKPPPLDAREVLASEASLPACHALHVLLDRRVVDAIEKPRLVEVDHALFRDIRQRPADAVGMAGG